MMREINGKELRCKVRTDTTYGKKVLKCVELLKDRTGLAVTNLIQEALISYEQITREYEEESGIVPEQFSKQENTISGEVKQEAPGTHSGDLLRLSTDEVLGY